MIKKYENYIKENKDGNTYETFEIKQVKGLSIKKKINSSEIRTTPYIMLKKINKWKSTKINNAYIPIIIGGVHLNTFVSVFGKWNWIFKYEGYNYVYHFQHTNKIEALYFINKNKGSSLEFINNENYDEKNALLFLDSFIKIVETHKPNYLQ